MHSSRAGALSAITGVWGARVSWLVVGVAGTGLSGFGLHRVRTRLKVGNAGFELVDVAHLVFFRAIHLSSETVDLRLQA